MAELRMRGSTYGEIARKLGVALQTVAKHMRDEGLGGREKKVTEEMIEEMRGLREEGVPKKEIADRLGLSYGAVLWSLRKEGFFEKLKRKIGPR